MVIPRISNPNSRKALNPHSSKSYTPPLADQNIDSVALTLLFNSGRLGLRYRVEAQGKAAINEARNILNNEQIALEIRLKMLSELIDSLLKEIGVSAGDINGLTQTITNPLGDESVPPVKD